MTALRRCISTATAPPPPTISQPQRLRFNCRPVDSQKRVADQFDTTIEAYQRLRPLASISPIFFWIGLSDHRRGDRRSGSSRTCTGGFGLRLVGDRAAFLQDVQLFDCSCLVDCPPTAGPGRSMRADASTAAFRMPEVAALGNFDTYGPRRIASPARWIASTLRPSCA